MEPKRNFIRTLGVACAIVVVLGGVVWYAKADADKKYLAIQQTRTEIRSKAQSLSALASLQGDAEKAKQYTPQIDRMLTTREQLLSFSTDIGFLAQQTGFTGSPKFKEGAASPAGDLQKISFSLFLEGPKNIDDVGKFFKLIEQSKYYVRFGSIDVGRDGNNLRVTADGYVLAFPSP